MCATEGVGIGRLLLFSARFFVIFGADPGLAGLHSIRHTLSGSHCSNPKPETLSAGSSRPSSRSQLALNLALSISLCFFLTLSHSLSLSLSVSKKTHSHSTQSLSLSLRLASQSTNLIQLRTQGLKQSQSHQLECVDALCY